MPRLKGKRIVLDLKEHERLICQLLSDAINACEGNVILLSWSDRRPTTKHVVYRATDYRFSPSTTFDGIACKFSGSALNKGCIDRTLANGIPVNLFAPKTKDQHTMLNVRSSHSKQYNIFRKCKHASGLTFRNSHKMQCTKQHADLDVDSQLLVQQREHNCFIASARLYCAL